MFSGTIWNMWWWAWCGVETWQMLRGYPAGFHGRVVKSQQIPKHQGDGLCGAFRTQLEAYFARSAAKFEHRLWLWIHEAKEKCQRFVQWKSWKSYHQISAVAWTIWAVSFCHPLNSRTVCCCEMFKGKLMNYEVGCKVVGFAMTPFYFSQSYPCLQTLLCVEAQAFFRRLSMPSLNIIESSNPESHPSSNIKPSISN